MSDITMGGAPGGAPGGVDSNEGAIIAPPGAPPGGGALMHCTLPLGIALVQQPNQMQTRIDWKQFQTSPMLIFILMDANNLPMNLTGALSATLRIASIFGGTVTSDALTVLYAAGGQFGYVPQALDVANAGTYQFDIEVVDANGNILYYPSDGTVLFVIHPSLGGP